MASKSNRRAISPTRFVADPDELRYLLVVSPVQCHLPKENEKKNDHKSNCKCRVCKNSLILILTMTSLTLEGEIWKREQSIHKAVESFDKALVILNKLENIKRETKENLMLKLSGSIDIDFVELDYFIPINFHCTKTLIKYAMIQSSNELKCLEKVKKTLERISKILKNLSVEKNLLMWKFVELKLVYLVLTKTSKPKSKFYIYIYIK